MEGLGLAPPSVQLVGVCCFLADVSCSVAEAAEVLLGGETDKLVLAAGDFLVGVDDLSGLIQRQSPRQQGVFGLTMIIELTGGSQVAFRLPGRDTSLGGQ